MAYTEFPTGHLFKSKLDGSQATQLTDFPVGGVRWSPDGKSLVYTDDDKLYLISADGGAPEKLIATGEHENAPDWSPDGKSISFTYYNSTDQPTGGIFTVDLASRKVLLEPDTQGLLRSSWSPDGKYRWSYAEQPSRMMLYSSKTRTWKVLTQIQEPVDSGTWARDSKSVFIKMIQGRKGIYRLTVPDGKWEKVSDLAGTYGGERRPEPHSRWTAGDDVHYRGGADLCPAVEALDRVLKQSPNIVALRDSILSAQHRY